MKSHMESQGRPTTTTTTRYMKKNTKTANKQMAIKFVERKIMFNILHVNLATSIIYKKLKKKKLQLLDA